MINDDNKNTSETTGLFRFLIIWFGDFISTIGSGLTAFVLGVYAFKTTGQATSASLVVLFTFLPAFLLRPIGGVLADRMDRRILMVFGNIGSAIGIGVVLFFIGGQASNLNMIYLGVAISSVFFAFQNPAYKASVSDFLPQELYAKASGLVQLSSSAQFLVAPIVAGFLMSILDNRYILLIDIMSFVFSALAVVLVMLKIKSKVSVAPSSTNGFLHDMLIGAQSIIKDRGILILTTLVSLILFYIGLLQALLGPMILSFANSRVLGAAQSICAVGMLISSLLIGILGSKKKQIVILTISLALMGLCFSFIGILPNVWAIIIPGFLFFSTIPFVNSSIEVMIRKNISNDKQGRVWSLISLITYFGAMVAYTVAGFLADKIFNPLFVPGGLFANNLGHLFGVGPGRGIAFIFFISGLFVVLLALIIARSKAISVLDVGVRSAD